MKTKANRFGVRRQSVSGDGAFASTRLDAPDYPERPARPEPKAAWRFASRRSPKRARANFGLRRQSVSGDGAFDFFVSHRSAHPPGIQSGVQPPHSTPESGVALRFPPQSKTRPLGPLNNEY